MSSSQGHRLSRRSRTLCASCRERKARFSTGARSAPIATTPCASSATVARSIAPGRAASEIRRRCQSCRRRLRRRISPVAACWIHEGLRIGSSCSTTCRARPASPRNRSALPWSSLSRLPTPSLASVDAPKRVAPDGAAPPAAQAPHSYRCSWRRGRVGLSGDRTRVHHQHERGAGLGSQRHSPRRTSAM